MLDLYFIHYKVFKKSLSDLYIMMNIFFEFVAIPGQLFKNNKNIYLG